jgi:outer membrane protein TolC
MRSTAPVIDPLSRAKRRRLIALALIVGAGCHSVDQRAPVTEFEPASVVNRKLSEPSIQLARHDEAASKPPPAIPPLCSEYPVDLPTVLCLAGASNPTIALAREAVITARAEQSQANTLLLPTLHVGADFNSHQGNLQTSRGVIVDVDRQSAFVGAGAAAVGAGTVTVPGVRLVGHLADAWFEPQAARQQVTAASSDSRAVCNSILRDAAVQYFALLGAQARLAALRQSIDEIDAVVRQTASFAKAGQGRQSDADRAASEAHLLQTQAQHAEEDVAVAAAELSRLLSLDPTCGVRPSDESLGIIELVDPSTSLESLIQSALRCRPEVAARSATIAEREARLSEERVRPFVPLVSVGYSAGGFGGGSNLADTRFGPLRGRGDFDAHAVWSLANFGFGNAAVQRQRRAQVGQAEADRLDVITTIRREVADAFADVAAQRQQIEIAKRQLRSAEEGFRLDMQRSRNLEGLPIEVLDSVELLVTARLAAVQAAIGFNQAQVRLFVALGQAPN